MSSKLRIAGALGVALALWAASARAQEPKVGDYYTDDTELGFKVKVPLKWDLIPAPPDDGNLIAKFDPKGLKTVLVGTKNLPVHCWVVKFDRRKSASTDLDPSKGGKQKFVQVEKNITEWVNHNVEGSPGFKIDTQKDVEVNKVPATRYVFLSKNDPMSEVRTYAMVYKLKPEIDVALVFNGPGDAKHWDKWDNAFEEMARSFKTAEIKTSKLPAEAAVGASLRDQKRAEILKRLAREPAWKMYETPHYFIVSNKDDKALIAELQDRLEAIHEVYEQDYPPAKAAELRAAGAAAKTGDLPGVPASGTTEDPKAPKEEPVDPQERAKCSVVRFCATEDQYHSYGGPGSSAGYWNPSDEELVLYVDKDNGIRGTWAVMNHEAFHQYIFYFYGNISPHSWYNEGTGDFYAGLEYKNKRFTLKKFDWRVSTIKDGIQQDDSFLKDKELSKDPNKRGIVPLKDFVKFTQAEYYNAGNNKYQLDGHRNYAQGWSFIYFLRTGKKANAKGWDSKWDGILETYLRVLGMTGKLDQAVTEAFQGVDFDALEASWKDYTR